MCLRQQFFGAKVMNQDGSRRLVFSKIGAMAAMVLFFFAAPTSAKAASLYISPAGGSYAVGSTLQATVYVSSPDEAINATSGFLSFPQDKLDVTDLTRSGSVFGLWIKDPTFSNVTGSIDFKGVVPNPGYQGSSGKVLTIIFRVKAEGAAKVSFVTGSILANDGQGTEVVSGLSGATFNLVGTKTPVKPLPSGVAMPRIVSTTHPDPDAWYASREAVFSWSVPAGVDTVRTRIGPVPDSTPTVNYSPPISSKTVKDLNDGVWYFHAQFKKDQVWGPIAQYRVQIDTKDPERFEIRELQRAQPTDPARFLFDAVDSGSGISRFEVRIDGNQPVEWLGSASSTYEAPQLEAGPHMLNVRAYDRAGHYLSAVAGFLVVEPPAETPPLPTKQKEPDSQKARIVARGFWMPFAAGAATTALALAIAYLLGSVRRLRLRVQRAIRYGRREASDAFHDLRKGATARETEKRVLEALDEIDKQVK